MLDAQRWGITVIPRLRTIRYDSGEIHLQERTKVGWKLLCKSWWHPDVLFLCRTNSRARPRSRFWDCKELLRYEGVEESQETGFDFCFLIIIIFEGLNLYRYQCIVFLYKEFIGSQHLLLRHHQPPHQHQIVWLLCQQRSRQHQKRVYQNVKPMGDFCVHVKERLTSLFFFVFVIWEWTTRFVAANLWKVPENNPRDKKGTLRIGGTKSGDRVCVPPA